MAEKLFLFTQQTVGLGARKTSMVFLAEAFAALGHDVHVVTCQLSQLSRLKADSRLDQVPQTRRNIWYDAEGLKAFVFVPAVHPVSAGGRAGRALTAPLSSVYGRLMPAILKERVQDAAIVVIESCAALALFPQLKRLSPDAAFVYSMSDRLDVVGMHPRLETLLQQYGPRFDLVRVPARALLDDVPGAASVFLPQGIDKKAFASDAPSPFDASPNALLIGDMMLDRGVLKALVTQHHDVRFHYFGRTPLDIGAHPNLTEHGEQPFSALVPYLKHADAGLSLYRYEEGLDYLAESSLKNVQYAYCGLPLVCPAFAARDKPHAFSYEAGDAAGASAALTEALAAGRRPGNAAEIPDWHDVGRSLLAALEERKNAH